MNARQRRPLRAALALLVLVGAASAHPGGNPGVDHSDVAPSTCVTVSRADPMHARDFVRTPGDHVQPLGVSNNCSMVR